MRTNWHAQWDLSTFHLSLNNQIKQWPPRKLSKTPTASDTYTGPITYSRSKGVMQEKEQGSIVAENIWKRLTESPKGRIVIIENPLFDSSAPTSNQPNKESHLDVMSVMMADVMTEAAMAEMERKINLFMKAIEERDHKIAALRDQMQVRAELP